MSKFDSLWPEYADLVESMKVKAGSQGRVAAAAKLAMAHKARYLRVEKKTGTPWELVAVLHMRESNHNFSAHLHNGDPLTARTVHVPKGRPKAGSPPFTWEASAIDALEKQGLTGITDWSFERLVYEAERYNGWGYRTKGRRSPYLWAGTNHYTRGKYTSDGKFSKTAVDKQLGVVPVLKEIHRIDVTDREVVAKSRRLTFGKRVRGFVQWAGLGSLFSMSFLGEISAFLTDWRTLAILGAGGVFWFVLKYSEWMGVREYKEGRYAPSSDMDGE